MSYYFARLTHSTIGVKTRTPGFQPAGARITIGARDGATQTWIQDSVGVTDGTNHYCKSMWGDTTVGLASKNETTCMASQYDKVSGVWGESIRATFDSFNATQFKYNVTVAGSTSGSFTFVIECWD